MSKMFRSLKRTLKEIKGERWTVFERLDEWITHTKIYDKMETYYYNVKHFLYQLPMFIKMAWQWRSWDSAYTLDVFTKLLRKHGDVFKDNDRHKGAQRCYRRAYTAAGMLDKAYEGGVDKTLIYLMRKNPIKFVKLPDERYSTTQRVQVTDKRIYEGMYKVASKRSDKAEALRKQEAWAYVHKYYEHFWN